MVLRMLMSFVDSKNLMNLFARWWAGWFQNKINSDL